MAYLTHAAPTPLEVLTEFVREGFDEVVIAPLFLLPADHSERDIPLLQVEAARRFPRLALRILPPLGTHAVLRRWSALQFLAAYGRLRKRIGPTDSIRHLFVGRGGRRPNLRSYLHAFLKTAVDVELPRVETTVCLLTDDDWIDTLRDGLRSGPCIVQTHLLFAGTLSRRIDRAIGEVVDEDPSRHWQVELIEALVLADHIGDFCREVLAAYLEVGG